MKVGKLLLKHKKKIIVLVILLVLYSSYSHYMYIHPPQEVIFGMDLTKVGYGTAIPYGCLYSLTHPVENKDIYICFSIDGDLPENRTLANNAINYTLRLLQEDLEGNVTWFINENDCHWTKNYQNALRVLIEKNYDIELHSHYLQKYWDESGQKPTYEQILKQHKRDKEFLEAFIEKETDKPYDIIGFRGGCHVMIPESYKAMKALNIKYDSSEFPGVKRYLQHSFFDYTEVPMSKNWYLRDDGILELPVYRMIPTLTYMNVVEKSNKQIIVLSHLIHPYELVKEDGSLNEKKYIQFKIQFWLLKYHYPHAKWVTTREMYFIL